MNEELYLPPGIRNVWVPERQGYHKKRNEYLRGATAKGMTVSTQKSRKGGSRKEWGGRLGSSEALERDRRPFSIDIYRPIYILEMRLLSRASCLPKNTHDIRMRV